MSYDLDKLSDEGIFSDTSNIIKETMVKAYEKNGAKTNIAKTAFEIALSKLN